MAGRYMGIGENDESMVLSKVGAKYHYNRTHSPSSNMLSYILREKYGVNRCEIVPSGMSAISTTIRTLVDLYGVTKSKMKFNLIYGNELYCDTPTLFSDIANGNTEISKTYTVDVTNPRSIIDLFSGECRGNFNVLFIESATNPSGMIFDFDIIPTLRNYSGQLIVVVDNTWLTELLFNPFEHGADIVVVSLTKYYSADHAIAGAILGNDVSMEYISRRVSVNGLHVSPFTTDTINHYVRTMRERLFRSSELTVKVVRQLVDCPKVMRIMHPSVMPVSHNKYLKDGLYPSVFTFGLKTTKNRLLEVLRESPLIEHKTSFGCKMSRTDPWPKQIGDIVMCRVAVGYSDNFEHIMRGLMDVIDKA